MMRYLEYDLLKDHGLQHFDNTVFEMEDKIARFPEQEQKLTAILANLHTDREALRNRRDFRYIDH